MKKASHNVLLFQYYYLYTRNDDTSLINSNSFVFYVMMLKFYQLFLISIIPAIMNVTRTLVSSALAPLASRNVQGKLLRPGMKNKTITNN